MMAMISVHTATFLCKIWCLALDIKLLSLEFQNITVFYPLLWTLKVEEKDLAIFL